MELWKIIISTPKTSEMEDTCVIVNGIECRQHVTQLRSHDGAVALLVKNPEPLHKILKVALIFNTGDMLQHWQEGLKIHHFSAHVLWPRFAEHFEHICIGWVLAQSSHHVSALAICDLHFSGWRAVEQGEERTVKDSKPLIPEITVGMRAGRLLVWSALIKERDRGSGYIPPMTPTGGYPKCPLNILDHLEMNGSFMAMLAKITYNLITTDATVRVVSVQIFDSRELQKVKEKWLGHLVVGVVVTTDAEAKELASGALDLEPLDLQGTLQEPVAGLKVPVAAPQEMHTADGQELPHRAVTVNEVGRGQLVKGFHVLSSVDKLPVQLVFGQGGSMQAEERSGIGELGASVMRSSGRSVLQGNTKEHAARAGITWTGLSVIKTNNPSSISKGSAEVFGNDFLYVPLDSTTSQNLLGLHLSSTPFSLSPPSCIPICPIISVDPTPLKEDQETGPLQFLSNL
ncbi:hypothetical protein EYF80_006525 [Liparis tanakae]|uniref:Uncharacterized protein n=1 Tax=Liparis tanakae TaxID=230148 RepID=A0A4Z2J0Y2_9TELE|nr:hypothetical protein EYF80_006525 [Liparis tanakae]